MLGFMARLYIYIYNIYLQNFKFISKQPYQRKGIKGYIPFQKKGKSAVWPKHNIFFWPEYDISPTYISLV